MTQPPAGVGQPTDDLVLTYQPDPVESHQAEPGSAEDNGDDIVQVGWQILRDTQTKEWAFYLTEIGDRGSEELLAVMPLDPEVASEMSTALAQAYRDMTGQELAAEHRFAGADDADRVHWWSRSSWSRSQILQTVLLGAILLVIVIVFIINTIAG